MAKILSICFLLPVFIIPFLLPCCSHEVTVVPYPAIPGLETSDLYNVTVNGQPVWTEKFRTQMDLDSLPDWFVSEPYTQVRQEIHFTSLSGDKNMLVHVEVSEPVSRVSIRPVSRNIRPEIHGKAFEFTLTGPDKLYIEVNDLAPLCLFISPPEKEVPGENDPGVRYFGPGIHRPGLMTLNNDETVYIAGGAIVYGGIRVNGTSGIRVLGRGILDGGFEYPRMVLIKNGDRIEVRGIVIRNGRSWTNTVINCTNVTYEDVKVISFGPGGDGINPLGSRHFIINDCFLRCTDDCIAIKSPDTTQVVRDVQVTNNTMIGYAFSDGITIGFETNGPVIEDVTVRNCDILMARGGSRVDGHSAFSVICDGPSTIRNILFEDIRVEHPVLKLFELNITDGTKYGVNPPGHIQDIHLKNISWEQTGPVILKGFDKDHLVQHVLFENCTIEGKPLESPDNAYFQINDYASDVSVR
jgi:hypothetical protein